MQIREKIFTNTKRRVNITAISFVRTLIAYVLVVFALRIMGKRQIGELQPSELVVAIMISDIASIPLGDSALPFSSGIVPILTLISAEILASLLSLKFPKIRKALSGTPAVIIKNGKIQLEEMRKNRYNLEDLAEALRMKDYFSIDEVHTAVLETNGSLSVIPMSDAKTPTLSELGIKTSQQTLPHVIIADGQVYPEHMKEAGVNEQWLKNQLKDKNISQPEEVFLMTVDANMKVSFQKKE